MNGGAQARRYGGPAQGGARQRLVRCWDVMTERLTRGVAAGLAFVWLSAGPPGGDRASAVADSAAPEVVCEVVEDGPGRTYRLHAEDGASGRVWWLSLRGPATNDRWVAVRLPGASPVFGDDGARLVYRTANGGIMIDLEARSERASIDVYVSYELEVNVDVSLSPSIDLLNTDGRLANVTCEVVTQ